MPLYIGNDKIKSIYLGDQKIKKIYKGTELLYSTNGVNILPSGYTQVEYIENPDTHERYIQTNIQPNDTTKISLDVEFFATPASLYSYLYFSKMQNSSSSYSSHVMAYYSKDGITVCYGKSTKTSPRFVLSSDKTPRRFNLIVDYGGRSAEIVGEVKKSIPSDTFELPQTNLQLFGISGGKFVRTKIYYCKIELDGNVVGDFIPCINPSGISGMFNLIDSTFYGSATTEAYTAGPEV